MDIVLLIMDIIDVLQFCIWNLNFHDFMKCMQYDFFKCHLTYNYSEILSLKFLVVIELVFRDLIYEQIDDCFFIGYYCIVFLIIEDFVCFAILLNAWDVVFNVTLIFNYPKNCAKYLFSLSIILRDLIQWLRFCCYWIYFIGCHVANLYIKVFNLLWFY